MKCKGRSSARAVLEHGNQALQRMEQRKGSAGARESGAAKDGAAQEQCWSTGIRWCKGWSSARAVLEHANQALQGMEQCKNSAGERRKIE